MATAFVPPTTDWQPRARCLRCRRPKVTCYCAHIPRLDTETRVVILQHARERDMPIGTARMASLALANSELHVGVRWADHVPLARALANAAAPPILLYPGDGAKDILTEPPTTPVTLVVVDGTWSQAKTVVRDNPILHALPRYAFAAPEPSRYRIRKEPRAEYCSTIEALMHVLGVLERDPPRFRALLAPFEAMIDAQLAAAATAPQRGARQAVKKRPLTPHDRIPRALVERWDDLVLLVGEANAFPYASGENPHPDEPIHWLACRPATGEVFDQIVAPAGPLSPTSPFHAELEAAAILAGAPRADAAAAFARWLKPTDVVASWGRYACDLLGVRHDLDLRVAAQRIATNRRVGALETYANAMDLTRVAPGRGGVRLAMLVAIVHAWRALP